MKRTLVVGDIHGGFKALLQVLERAKVTPEDRVIFLGDYVDGWSESSELIEFLIKFKKNNSNTIFLLGNHDDWCRNWLLFDLMPGVWTRQGGEATVASYLETGYTTDRKHIDFFRDLELFY